MPLQSQSQLFKRLWSHIDHQRKLQFYLLLILMIFASLSEMLSIGSVVPFLALLTSPERVFMNDWMQPLIQLLGATTPSELLMPLTSIFCLASLFAGLMRLFLLWSNNKLSFNTAADLDIRIYRRTLYQPYSVHIARNSSEVISGISSKTNAIIYGFILPMLTLSASGVMLIVIIFGLLAIDPLITLLSLAGFGLIYILVIKLSKKRLRQNSILIAHHSTNVIRALQEGLGGIRDVLVDGTQEFYSKIYGLADITLRSAQASNKFIAQAPRYATETFGMLMIAGMTLVLANKSDSWSTTVPILGTLAFAAQRLLPILQQSYMSWASICGDHASLQDALDLLDQPFPDILTKNLSAALQFRDRIEIDQVSFQYTGNSQWALRNINLTIMRGSRVGFIGKTGCGKSTLIDIVMGLLIPTSGEVRVDGKKITHENIMLWQRHIAHVPQNIYLADATIEENIAFGVSQDQIDRQRVTEAAHKAQISDLIDTLADGYQTKIGERGVRLSGGQRQRLGIARALYKQANVIIFDEATSALDSQTEHSVMQAIESLGTELTILIIAHRIDTLKGCSKIVELEDGAVKRIASYQRIASE